MIGGNSDIVSALSSARSSATESTVTSRSDERGSYEPFHKGIDLAQHMGVFGDDATNLLPATSLATSLLGTEISKSSTPSSRTTSSSESEAGDLSSAEERDAHTNLSNSEKSGQQVKTNVTAQSLSSKALLGRRVARPMTSHATTSGSHNPMYRMDVTSTKLRAGSFARQNSAANSCRPNTAPYVHNKCCRRTMGPHLQIRMLCAGKRYASCSGRAHAYTVFKCSAWRKAVRQRGWFPCRPKC